MNISRPSLDMPVTEESKFRRIAWVADLLDMPGFISVRVPRF